MNIANIAFLSVFLLIPPSAGVLPTSTYAPIAWAPHGRWMAFTSISSQRAKIPDRDWLYTLDGSPPRQIAGPSGPRASLNRLYAYDTETGASVLLEESPWPLSSPTWNHSGDGVAFSRISRRGEGTFRFEVVIQEGPSQKRVVLSQEIEGDPGTWKDTISSAISWSRDGRYLAVPLPGPRKGLIVIRADNGTVLKTLEGATWPAWSPDGLKLAFIKQSATSRLLTMDAGFGPPRQLLDLGQTFQPPIWSSDKISIFALARRGYGSPLFAPPPIEVVEMRFDGSAVKTFATLNADPLGPAKGKVDFSLAMDGDGEEVFSTLISDDLTPVIVWSRPRTRETVDRFHPLDLQVRLNSLTLSPTGRILAFRSGMIAGEGPLGYRKLGVDPLIPVVTDARSRVEWINLLITNARPLLKQGLPRPSIEGRSVQRPTIIPIAGELATNPAVAARLRFLGRVGRSLCRAPELELAEEPELARFLDEARLFFESLSDDHAAALATLPAVEVRTNDPRELLRLLYLRAQLSISSGRDDAASDTILYLQRLGDARFARIEETTAGRVLTRDPSSIGDWGKYLSLRLDDALKSKTPGDVSETLNARVRRFPPRARMPQDFDPPMGNTRRFDDPRRQALERLERPPAPPRPEGPVRNRFRFVVPQGRAIPGG